MLSTAITILIVYGGYSMIYAATDEPGGCKTYRDSFDTPPDSSENLENFYKEVSGYDSRGTSYSTSFEKCPYYDLKKIYHEKMNDFFNKKFADFLERVSKNSADTFAQDPRIFAPELTCLDEKNRTDCEKNNNGWKKRNEIETKCKDNLSSYCVSMVALYRYIDYVEIAKRLSTSLPPIGTTDESMKTWRGLADAIMKQDDDMKKEFGDIKVDKWLYGDAQKVMKATVTAYDEFKTAYPMHIKYDKIVKDLIKYKQKLKTIRNNVMIFPTKFVDITSITCP